MAQAQTEQQANDMSAIIEEQESLISTLPTRDGWWEPLLLLQGCCWLPSPMLRSILTMQAQFHPRHDDIILATHPKCGTTWLKSLAFTVLNRSKHPVIAAAINGHHRHPLLSHNPHDLVPYLELPSRRLHPVAELEEMTSPRLLATHVPFGLLPSSTPPSSSSSSSTASPVVVYLCREPKDVLVSLWHHVNKVFLDSIEFDKAFELFCDGCSFFGPIWEHYLGYWNQSKIQPEKVLFLKYAEMIAEPARHVKILAEFLGVPFTDEEEGLGAVEEVVKLCSFEHLKSLPVNTQDVSSKLHGSDNSLFFRAAKGGDWANYMTEEMAQKLDCIIHEKLQGSGLTF